MLNTSAWDICDQSSRLGVKGGLQVETESFKPDEGWDLSGAELINYIKEMTVSMKKRNFPYHIVSIFEYMSIFSSLLFFSSKS